EGYMREVPCPVCCGARLKPESLAVQVGGRSISQICALAIADCAKFLAEIDFPAGERQIAERVIKEIEARLGFLLDVGLDYLSLDRAAGTLSGREAQRIAVGTARAVGWRGAADPAGHADRVRAGRGPLRARRAVDRVAPAGQPPVDRDAHPA